jgi:hypothetical protein
MAPEILLKFLNEVLELEAAVGLNLFDPGNHFLV